MAALGLFGLPENECAPYGLAKIRSVIPQVSMRSDCVAEKSSRWLCSAFALENPG